MTMIEKEIRMMDDELLEMYENNVTTREVEFDKYGRVTKNTMARYEAMKREILRRMDA